MWSCCEMNFSRKLIYLDFTFPVPVLHIKGKNIYRKVRKFHKYQVFMCYVSKSRSSGALRGAEILYEMIENINM